jgi:hypothetical protein
VNRYGLLMGAILGLMGFVIAAGAIESCTRMFLEASISNAPPVAPNGQGQ